VCGEGRKKEMQRQLAPGSQRILCTKELKLCLKVKSGIENSGSKGNKIKSKFQKSPFWLRCGG